MRRHLEAQGLPADFIQVVDLLPSDGGNIRAAQDQIAPAIEQLLARARNLAGRHGASLPTKVDIVAHSMGALSSRYYATRMHPEHVRTVITFGGANHGSNRFCPPGEAAGEQELCPAFAVEPLDGVQVLLNGTPASPADETPWGIGPDPAGRSRVEPDSARCIRYATVDPDLDTWIIPYSSLQLAGTGSFALPQPLPRHVSEVGTGRYVVAGTDHDAIVSASSAMTLVGWLLAAGEGGQTDSAAIAGPGACP